MILTYPNRSRLLRAKINIKYTLIDTWTQQATLEEGGPIPRNRLLAARAKKAHAQTQQQQQQNVLTNVTFVVTRYSFRAGGSTLSTYLPRRGTDGPISCRTETKFIQ